MIKQISVHKILSNSEWKWTKVQQPKHSLFRDAIKILNCYYCPVAIIKNPYSPFIGLKVLNDGPIFSARARCQERGSFVYKHRWMGEAKTKVYIFIYKTFTNIFFKSYTAITTWCRALAKWSHYNVKPLQSDVIFS